MTRITRILRITRIHQENNPQVNTGNSEVYPCNP
jgi:hypothetical protein